MRGESVGLLGPIPIRRPASSPHQGIGLVLTRLHSHRHSHRLIHYQLWIAFLSWTLLQLLSLLRYAAPRLLLAPPARRPPWRNAIQRSSRRRRRHYPIGRAADCAFVDHRIQLLLLGLCLLLCSFDASPGCKPVISYAIALGATRSGPPRCCRSQIGCARYK